MWFTLQKFCPQVDIQHWFKSQSSKVDLSGSKSALTTQLIWQVNWTSSLDSLCLPVSTSLAMWLCSSLLLCPAPSTISLTCTLQSNHMELCESLNMMSPYFTPASSPSTIWISFCPLWGKCFPHLSDSVLGFPLLGLSRSLPHPSLTTISCNTHHTFIFLHEYLFFYFYLCVFTSISPITHLVWWNQDFVFLALSRVSGTK